MGLNESVSAARGQILMMTPLPSLAQAFSLIKQEERQRQGTSVATSFMANARNGPRSSGNTTTFGVHEYVKKQQLKCTYCQTDGHLKENCFKLIGYPPKGKAKGKFARKQSQAMQVSTIGNAGFSGGTNVVSGSTVKDSGDLAASGNSNANLEQLQQQVI